MYRYLTVALAYPALALPAFHANAQQRPPVPPSASVAADVNARVPEAKYDSAFTGYQPFREQKLAPWRELNDDVHKAGGHIGIFRGSSVGNAGGTRAAPPAHPPEHKK